MNKLLLATLISGVLSTSAFAVSVEAAEEKAWKAQAELGGTMTTGNTETSTVKAKVAAEHDIANWKNKYLAELLYSDDKGTKTANKWKVGAKGNYVFNDISSLFVLGEYEVDDFSDYDSTTSAAFGYTRRLYQAKDTFLDADIGPGAKFFDLKDGGTETTATVHVGAQFETNLSEHSRFKQTLVSDIALDSEASTVSRSETSVSANVMDNLAMKFSYIVKHDNHPGEGKDNVDTETTVTLLYTF